MEYVALNNVQLDYLARDDPRLKPVFYGTVACQESCQDPTPRVHCQHRSPRSTGTTLVSGLDGWKRV